ncbi:MAG: C25 family cysteine peptidase, partial [Candidatus Cloacimonetes bacterium]|nr:C25 family cysteine peptidase [Candidatus Cloacimonadota bacterium]
MHKIMLSMLMLLTSMALVGTVTYEVSLGSKEIVQRGEYVSIQMAGAHVNGEAGQPALPWIGIKLLLPVGTKATEIKVERQGAERLRLDKTLSPIQEQYPISMAETPELTTPDPTIYKTNAVFPQTPHTGVYTQYLSGHPIFFSAVCPFDYNPVTGELLSYSTVRVTVETATDKDSPVQYGLLKEDIHTRDRLIRSVDNPQDVPRYTLPSQGYDYIIIYDSAKYAQWLPLKTLYDTRGYNVLMKPIQDIYAQYTGASNPVKIRNFLIAMYANNAIRYVLLAGDTEVIPYRGLYATVGNYTNASIPADIYYASLDGNWNSNGNTYWGELGEADLVPEFAIGRVSYNDDTEIANFLAKLTNY